jgi:hemerythrin superfamily protein
VEGSDRADRPSSVFVPALRCLTFVRPDEEENVNALKLLETQHREVETLFEEFESAGDGARKTKERLCAQIADALALHAELEEKLFYPEMKEAIGQEGEELLREAVEEHLSVKRLLDDLLDSSASDDQFDAKMKVLKEQVEHHVGEEEGELWKKAKKACSSEELDDLGSRMEEMAEELRAEGHPAARISDQTDSPSQI